MGNSTDKINMYDMGIRPYKAEELLMHGIFVSNLAYRISREMGMNDEFCEKIAMAGVFHDIGKLRIYRYIYGENNEGNYVFVPRCTGSCLPERCDAKAMKRRFANPYNSNYMSNAIPVEFADCAPYVYEDDDYDDLSNEKFPPEDIRIYTDYGYLTVIFFTKYPLTYYHACIRSDKVRDFVLALRNANVRRKTDFIKFCAAYKKRHEVKCNDVFGCGVTIRSRFVRNDVSDYIQPDQNIIPKNVALEEYERKCDYKNFTPDNIAALVKYFTEKSNDHFKKY